MTLGMDQPSIILLSNKFVSMIIDLTTSPLLHSLSTITTLNHIEPLTLSIICLLFEHSYWRRGLTTMQVAKCTMLATWKHMTEVLNTELSHYVYFFLIRIHLLVSQPVSFLCSFTQFFGLNGCQIPQQMC